MLSSETVPACPSEESERSTFNFLVEIDGIGKGLFSEVSGVDAAIEVIEYRTGELAANAACNCPARYILRTMKVVTFAKEVDYVPYGPN